MTTETMTAAEIASLAATDQSTLQGQSGSKAIHIIAELGVLVRTQWDRANAAEGELAALRAQRDEWKLRCAQLEKIECDKAKEIRKLKSLAEFHLRNSDDEYDRRVTAESELGTLREELGNLEDRRAFAVVQRDQERDQLATLHLEVKGLRSNWQMAVSDGLTLRAENERLRGINARLSAWYCEKCNSVRPCPGCTIPAAPARTEARKALDDCKAMLRELNPRVCTEAEARVLEAIEQALKRLGDDPPYYEANDDMLGELGKLNPSLVQAINDYTTEITKRKIDDT